MDGERQGEQLGALLQELQDIKRLIVFWLMKNGTSQEEIGAALNVSQSYVSRTFAKGSGKRRSGRK